MKRKEAMRLKLFTVRLPEPLIDRLKFRALKEHTSVQTLMRQAVEELLKKKPEGADNG
jgi:predicted DNA binding CopG/RHH family protein